MVLRDELSETVEGPERAMAERPNNRSGRKPGTNQKASSKALWVACLSRVCPRADTHVVEHEEEGCAIKPGRFSANHGHQCISRNALTFGRHKRW